MGHRFLISTNRPLEPTVMLGIAEGRINPIDKSPLSGPVNQKPNRYVKHTHTYVGKENRHVRKTIPDFVLLMCDKR
jgi:hypothetical protein